MADVSDQSRRAPIATSAAVTRVMQGNRGRDTAPEMAIRRAVHALGLRYRVSARPIPSLRRTADLVFTQARVAIFVDGCYWHGCPDHYRPARTNAEFWSTKIAQNRSRDAQTDSCLREAGWVVIRIWEHEDPATAAERVRMAVMAAREATPRSVRERQVTVGPEERLSS